MYEGNWCQNKKHGEGKLIFANKDIYTGKFNHDSISGYGSMSYSDGKIYVGEWKQNKRNGDGVLTLKSGDKFMGYFVDGFLNGYAECYL